MTSAIEPASLKTYQLAVACTSETGVMCTCTRLHVDIAGAMPGMAGSRHTSFMHRSEHAVAFSSQLWLPAHLIPDLCAGSLHNAQLVAQQLSSWS